MIHTYDWSQLTAENRFPRARSTSTEMLQASLDRLADVAPGEDGAAGAPE